MPHLVASLTPSHGESTGLSLARCHALPLDAHDYLARRGMDATRRAVLLEDASTWGTDFMRVRVELPPEGDSPSCVTTAGRTLSRRS